MMAKSSGFDDMISKLYEDAIHNVFTVEPARKRWLSETQDEFAKEWILALQEENKKLKEEKEQLYSEMRGLNSELGRTLWNPRG